MMNTVAKSRLAGGCAVPAAVREAAADWVARRDAGLTAAEERDYQAWLSADPQHAVAVARLDSAWRALDRPLRTGAAHLVLGELSILAKRRTRRRRLVAATGAAAILLALGVAWTSRQVQFEPNESSVAVTLPSIRSLPDGSVVEVQDGGQISVDFNDAARRVTLHHGEAHFQVATNLERPFVVVAGSLGVRAVGTSFSVQLGQKSVEVLVTSGRVALDVLSTDASSDGSELKTLAYVDAGSGVVVDVPAAPGHTPRVNPLASAEVSERLAWRNPRLEFSGTPLGEAVTLLNRHNQLQFTIEDPALAAVRVSGTFGAHNTEAFLRALEASFDVQGEKRGENEVVLRRER